MAEPKLGTAQRYGNVTSDVIKGYKAVLKEILSDFVLIDAFVYDPDMGLSPILRSEIVTSDFAKQMNGKANWLACVWGREMLKPCDDILKNKPVPKHTFNDIRREPNHG